MNLLDTQTPEKPPRIASLDQYRGYAILGMLLVNHLGHFKCISEQLRHHSTYITYADTIAPLFMFVVGMGFRLSLQRRIARDGARNAYVSALKRYLALICLGIVLYDPAPERWRYWWDALVDIGFGGMLALPFIMRGQTVRAIAGAGYWILYQALFLFTSYGAWTMKRSIDGGPLGPLSWAPILLFGTIAYDLIATRNNRTILTGCLAWGCALSVAGLLLHFPLPGIKGRWLFSQRSMEVPYPILVTGLCFFMYLPFYYFNDVKQIDLPTLAVIGMNPLIIYIVQYAIGEMYSPSLVVPQDCTLPFALLDFVFLYACCYAVAWKLHKDHVVIKL